MDSQPRGLDSGLVCVIFCSLTSRFASHSLTCPFLAPWGCSWWFCPSSGKHSPPPMSTAFRMEWLHPPASWCLFQLLPPNLSPLPSTLSPRFPVGAVIVSMWVWMKGRGDLCIYVVGGRVPWKGCSGAGNVEMNAGFSTGEVCSLDGHLYSVFGFTGVSSCKHISSAFHLEH